MDETEPEVARKGLMLPEAQEHEMDARSLGLRLEVSGDRITVLDSLEVDVPTFTPDRVPATDFLALHAGDELLAIKPLTGCGEGEAQLDTYEVTMLLPLDALERLADRDPQGASERALEIVMYRATGGFQPRQVASRDDLHVVASSGQLTLDSLRGVTWTDTKPRNESEE